MALSFLKSDYTVNNDNILDNIFENIDWKKIDEILDAPDQSFNQLVRVAGLNSRIDFVGADFSGLDLTGADLRGFNLSDCIITQEQLSKAKIDQTTILPQNLRHSSSKIYGEFSEIRVELDDANETLWALHAPSGRPILDVPFLEGLKNLLVGAEINSDISWLVFGSEFPGAFSLGTDLEFLADRIDAKDILAVAAYIRTILDTFEQLMLSQRRFVSLMLVEGDAIEMGVEYAACGDFIVAERGARFSLPSFAFNLPAAFMPPLLKRKMSTKDARAMQFSGRTYTAEEMHDAGFVDILAEPGDGRRTVVEFIQQHQRRQASKLASSKQNRLGAMDFDIARSRLLPIWIECASSLQPANIKMMRRLAALQARNTQRTIPDNMGYRESTT